MVELLKLIHVYPRLLCLATIDKAINFAAPKIPIYYHNKQSKQ